MFFLLLLLLLLLQYILIKNKYQTLYCYGWLYSILSGWIITTAGMIPLRDPESIPWGYPILAHQI